jgi:hypothetical protein
MLSERAIEQAHPEAFDFAFGNLPPAKRAGFNRHLTGCRYCQGIIDEYSQIGGIIKNLPPHVEPSADLEGPTVAAMAAAMAEQRAAWPARPSGAGDQAATWLYPVPRPQPSAEPETQVQPVPQLLPPPGDKGRPAVTRLPVRRRYRGRLAAGVAAAAAAITFAIAIPLSLLGSGAATVAIPLAATTAAKVSGFGGATGHATAARMPPAAGRSP